MGKPCENPVTSRQERKKILPEKRKRGRGPEALRLLGKEARKEAQRCLGSRECQSCEICSLFCPELCITREEKTGQVQIDLNFCKGCGICAAVCPKGAIEMVLENEG